MKKKTKILKDINNNENNKQNNIHNLKNNNTKYSKSMSFKVIGH